MSVYCHDSSAIYRCAKPVMGIQSPNIWRWTHLSQTPFETLKWKIWIAKLSWSSIMDTSTISHPTLQPLVATTSASIASGNLAKFNPFAETKRRVARFAGRRDTRPCWIRPHWWLRTRFAAHFGRQPPEVHAGHSWLAMSRGDENLAWNIPAKWALKFKHLRDVTTKYWRWVCRWGGIWWQAQLDWGPWVTCREG